MEKKEMLQDHSPQIDFSFEGFRTIKKLTLLRNPSDFTSFLMFDESNFNFF